MAISVRRPCRCGHERDQHTHYRAGTDCSGCACSAFHGQLEVTVRFGRRAVPAAAVVVPEQVPAAYEPYVRPTHSAGLTGVPLEGLVRPRTDEDSGVRKQHVG